MFGKFGIVIIVMAALVCAGVLTGGEHFDLHVDASFVPGLIIMAAAVILTVASPRILQKLPEEKRQAAEIIIRLGSVILCAAGALAVFCG